MSLKIIHTSDWHLGQTFFGYDRDEEHEAFLSWLTDTLSEQQTDVLLIAVSSGFCGKRTGVTRICRS